MGKELGKGGRNCVNAHISEGLTHWDLSVSSMGLGSGKEEIRNSQSEQREGGKS